MRPQTPARGPDSNELTAILLAVSDNGSQMISANTRKFMAMVAIAQHSRPSRATPSDQAWIESWTAGCFSDSACFVFQAAFVKSRKSRSTSFGVRYPRAE